MSQPAASRSDATPPAPPPAPSSMRLIVLLLLLAVVLTGFLVDLFWMFDSVKAAVTRLNNAYNEVAGRSIEKTKEQFLTREEVARAIGFQPTNSSVENGQLKEQYRWWGLLPLQRRFIEVRYKDEAGMKYDTYDVSNRDIFGNDEDELLKEAEQQPPADPGPNPNPMPIPMPMPQAPPVDGTTIPAEKPADEKPADEKPVDEKPADESTEK